MTFDVSQCLAVASIGASPCQNQVANDELFQVMPCVRELVGIYSPFRVRVRNELRLSLSFEVRHGLSAGCLAFG